MKNDTSSCSSLVKEALERILQACGSEWLHQRELSELKSACQGALASIKTDAAGPVISSVIDNADAGQQTAAEGNDHEHSAIIENDRYMCAQFTPFRMALESKISSVVIIALESLHRFLVHGYLRGNFPCTKNNKSMQVVDALVQSASGCVGTNAQDPKVCSALSTSIGIRYSYFEYIAVPATDFSALLKSDASDSLSRRARR